jgi:hypothetical protein
MREEAPDLWEGLGRLARELRMISPIATLKNAGKVTVESVDPKTHACVRRLGNQWFLIYVNPTDQTDRVRLVLPYWPGPREIIMDVKPLEVKVQRLEQDGRLTPFPAEIPDSWPPSRN